MRIEPVRRYAQPQLPTREIVDANPELLRLLPRRWQANSAVVAALAACLAMSSCGASAAGKSKAATVSRVAPIFEHGAGRGAYGCVSVNPPLFLSEQDAMEVINEEAKSVGIQFKPRVWCLKNVEVPREPKPAAKEDGNASDTQPELFTVNFDGTDKDKAIAYEYISQADLDNWGIARGGLFTTYDTVGTAKLLQKNLAKKQTPGTFAVFYAPCATAKETGGRTAAKEADREQLRAQVKDFIKWLKAQGVI